jgi:hypothetical protein
VKYVFAVLLKPGAAQATLFEIDFFSEYNCPSHRRRGECVSLDNVLNGSDLRRLRPFKGEHIPLEDIQCR